MSNVGNVEIYTWYAKMIGAFATMPEEQRLSLLRWEQQHIDGQITDTSDWPRWKQCLGNRPALGIHKPKQSKRPIPPEIRWAVWERDNFICQHCGTRRHLSVDHVIPESKGGTLALDNLQTLCKSCNSRKGASNAPQH